MKTFPWNGNVRELANVVQQMMIFCTGNVITIHDLPPRLFLSEENEPEAEKGEVQLMNKVSELERKWIFKKLMEVDWNQEKASKLLGITRKMLTNRIKKYHLEKTK